MEPNNPTPAPGVPPADPVVTTPTPSAEGNNKMLWWLVGGVVVIAILVAGIYFYMSSQQNAPTTIPSSQTTNTQPINTVQALENDLNDINAEQPDDLTSLDQDLSSL